MRAAVLGVGRVLVIDELRVDAPVGREVLVRVHAVGLCHSDAHVLDGTLVRPLPLVLGHESAGIVEAVGSDVRLVSVGDHVVTCLVMGCNDCARCDAGEFTRCLRPEQTKRSGSDAPRLSHEDGSIVGQMTNIGALAEYALVDERALVRVAEDIPMTTAAILGCAVVTGLGAVLNVARVRTGESVAIIGCGGVGLSVVQGARIAGATTIIAVDLSREKLDLARTLGATHTVDSSTVDAVAEVRALTGEGVDHAFEVVGRVATVRQAFEMAAPGRRAYALGIHADDAEILLPAVGLRRGKSLVGVFMGDTNPAMDIPRYVELWRSGELDLDGMISDVVALDGVADGFARMAAGAGARTVVSFAGPS